MAMLACATWASLSKSTSCGAISLCWANLSMRDFHVSARWKIFPKRPSSRESGWTCSVNTLSVSSFWVSLPTNMTPANTNNMPKTTTPTNFPICRMGTLPINIIINTTKLSKAAVDKFSRAMSGMMRKQMPKMYLKAILSAPWSVWSALKICAVANTTVPFAISDGWNCMPIKFTHRCAPLVDCPATITQSRVNTERRMKKGVAILKYLHLILSTTTMLKKPKMRMPICLMRGEK